jgi:hypothetical protein
MEGWKKWTEEGRKNKKQEEARRKKREVKNIEKYGGKEKLMNEDKKDEGNINNGR